MVKFTSASNRPPDSLDMISTKSSALTEGNGSAVNKRAIINKIVFQYPETLDLISIVMCVYNSAPYLRKMLDSIYAQTYKKFEVIVAYDTKSSDNSLEILKEYAEKYDLIIDYGNDSSIGFARVRGARLARGEYFIYLDSDDIILPTYLDDLRGCFLQYPEINIAYNYRNPCVEESELDLDNIYRKTSQSPNVYSLLNGMDCIHYYYYNSKSLYYISGVPWCWLVRRRYLKDIGCYFPDISNGEDMVYVCQLLIHAEKIGHCSRSGYIYISHPHSETHKQKPRAQLLNEICQIYDYIISLLVIVGCERIGIREKKKSIRRIPIAVVLNARQLPYSDFRLYLKKEGINHLPFVDNFSSRLSCLCFNVSKRLYWEVHHYLNMQKTV